MVFTANDLSEWEDFPKGLGVLILDEDINSAAEIKSKLEAMDYIVSVYRDENEALSAISSRPESFHVAIVEVSASNKDGSFKFLETAKDLPTIMTSNVHCLSTMMKCIALGAVEFLGKPLSEDKLRNIWQHVVHKAFSAGNVNSGSQKSVKDPVVPLLHLPLENGKYSDEELEKTKDTSKADINDREQSPGNDKYPAPSTPQLKQGARLLDDGDCQDQANYSTEKENVELDGESKSVETTCGNSMAEVTALVSLPQGTSNSVVKEEDDSSGISNCENAEFPRAQNKDSQKDSSAANEKPNTNSSHHNASSNKANRKKLKVDWTPELHKKFVQAVEQLGIDQAIPSRILELMKVEGLTRHNVASHLQKYRMHRRHILPKEDERRWPQRGQMQRSYCSNKPIMAFPPYHSSHAVAPAHLYPMWAHPHPANVQMWGSLGYAPWQPSESWHWKHYPGMHADAWGCPVMPPPQGFCSSFPQNAAGFYSASPTNNTCAVPESFFDFQPAEEVIDSVVKEAISKPWLPLPLGLKPPSTESVLAELSRQGISTIPPRINGSYPQ